MLTTGPSNPNWIDSRESDILPAEAENIGVSSIGHCLRCARQFINLSDVVSTYCPQCKVQMEDEAAAEVKEDASKEWTRPVAAVFTFQQNSDCEQGGDMEQELEVNVTASGFVWIQTQRWAMDLDELGQFCEMIKAAAATCRNL